MFCQVSKRIGSKVVLKLDRGKESDQKQDPRQAWNKSGAPLASSEAPGGVTHGITPRLDHPLVLFLESVWVLKFDCFFVVF